MDMEFTRHEPCYDRVSLALVLDSVRMKERILIGEELCIRRRLAGGSADELLCDVTRPLGTFLVDFEYDPAGDWNALGVMTLGEALQVNRWKQPALEQAAAGFLKAKADSGTPVRRYMAFRIWNDYLKARQPAKRKEARDRFIWSMTALTAAFQQRPLSFDEETGKPHVLRLADIFYGSAPDSSARLSLWYPDMTKKQECACAYFSFYPLLIYYLNKLDDWGLCFCRCKVCGQVFLAKSRHFELCSAECRRQQALQNKREFDERARGNGYDLLYKNECQNWRNRIKRAKKSPDSSPEHLEEMNTAFASFRKEALLRKRAVKTGKASPKEFSDWLYRQSAVIMELSQE